MDTPLKRIRLARNLTLTDVAEGTKIDAGNLSRLGRGIQNASPEVAETLSKFFEGGISEMEILYPDRYPAKAEKRRPARATS